MEPGQYGRAAQVGNVPGPQVARAGVNAMIRPPAIATDRARGRAGLMVSTFTLTSSRSAGPP